MSLRLGSVEHAFTGGIESATHTFLFTCPPETNAVSSCVSADKAHSPLLFLLREKYSDCHAQNEFQGPLMGRFPEL